MEQTGSIAIVLHAHLPYVRHTEDEFALEHRWLFEAMTESYIPLLQVFQQLRLDQVDFHLTLSVSPTLTALLSDDWMKSLYVRYIDNLIELAEQEILRTAQDADFAPLAVGYRDRFVRVRAFYTACEGDLLLAFRELQDAGCLELITCGATHAFLPLVQSGEAMRAQIGGAVASHVRAFGRAPRGFWLPECGFVPGVDAILREFSIDFFFVGETAFKTAAPPPLSGVYSPVLTPNGVAAFAGDGEATEQVWSSRVGYPGDPDYREYYRDIGLDLDLETVAPFIHPEGIRVNTGVKYYRVTGSGDHKEPYRPEWAAAKAAIHADHFVAECAGQLERAAAVMERRPLLVAPFDAELFGHWWYEGPQWLDALFRKLHGGARGVSTMTPSQYLDLYEDYPACELSMSSWGRDGYADVWLGETNDWVYPALHMAERRMRELVDGADDEGLAQPLMARALRQTLRELMLAQASDWAFMMDAGTTVQYAIRRTKSHVHRFMRLYEMIRARDIDEDWLSAVEGLDALLPELDYRLYRHPEPHRIGEPRGNTISNPRRGSLCILMLAWEYPPLMVGGLSRHVYDLSRYLVARGYEVHVVTTFGGEGERRETVEGVKVYRIDVQKPDGGEFIHWTLAMNMAMQDACEELIEREGIRFDVAHAHDWLVGYAASYVKERFSLPLIATIHATEHGRNGGIYTELQRQISAIEWQLTYDAREVIVCSTYMRRELETVFSLPTGKQHVIANGVDPSSFDSADSGKPARENHALRTEPVIVFVGRLVREKGVQTLIDAAPAILSVFPNARVVIVGKGPMMVDLMRQAQDLGVAGSVHFTGFVSDEERNGWLSRASVAVFPSLYEPFGIVALEAMAAQIPVVASDVGGLADVVAHGVNGLKSQPGNAASLAEQVIAVLQDPSLACEYAKVAHDELEKYDWRRIADQTAYVYRKALQPQEITVE